jgi:hypothetical protein
VPLQWTVEITEQFERWWEALSEEERVSVDGMIRVIEARGPALGPPYAFETPGSRHLQLRHLKVPHERRYICVLYIADESRTAVVLLTGTTTGSADDPCPPEDIERADSVYDGYLVFRAGPPN